MAGIDDLVDRMRRAPQSVRFSDLCRVCDHYFGTSRHSGTSHRVYQTPWPGDPRVNVQSTKGQAKAYQVKRVLKAIERLAYESHLR